MLRKFAALLLVALSMAIVPLTSSAHAETYGPKLPTTTSVKIKATNGKPLAVTISVVASDGSRPAGTVTYSIARAGGGGALVVARSTTGTTAIKGSTTVSGEVAHPGSYVSNASFTPANTAKYLPSRGADRASVSTSGPTGSTSTSGGGLPNTGGPDFAWIIAGFGLLIAGAGAIAFAARREDALAA
ncbi:LPXTG cell wall anchor domain-containing protein [Nocardioides montaniterrae]